MMSSNKCADDEDKPSGPVSAVRSDCDLSLPNAPEIWKTERIIELECADQTYNLNSRYVSCLSYSRSARIPQRPLLYRRMEDGAISEISLVC